MTGEITGGRCTPMTRKFDNDFTPCVLQFLRILCDSMKELLKYN